MSKSDSLRGQIHKLEGTLKSARDTNSKNLGKKKALEGNYADRTLLMADVSNKKDSDRFEIKYNEQQDRKLTNEGLQDTNQNALTNEDFCDIEPYDDYDEGDGVPYPSMSRFGALMPTLNETESQIDLRDFNDLKAPDDVANKPTEYVQHTETGYMRDLSSDQSESNEPDTPQQDADTGHYISYPLGIDYSREYSVDPNTYSDYERPATLFRNRARSKTNTDLKGNNVASKSSRSYSQTDPNIPTPTEEHYLEDSQTYAKPSLVVNTYRSEPNYDDAQPGEYDPNTLSPVAIKHIGSIGSTHSDSDSDFDNFIYERQEQNPQSVEEIRAKSPFYQPASKSSLAYLPQPVQPVQPVSQQEVVMRQKSRNPDQQKRVTMPQVADYEVPAAISRRSPSPYSTHKSSVPHHPDGKLLFRSFQSARDVSPYDTALTARKASIPNYPPIGPQYEPEVEVYQQAEERQVPYSQPSQRTNFNRNKSTNHRNYSSYLRQDIVSPTSPTGKFEYEDEIPYETTVNATEIMNRHPPPEYASPRHYVNIHHTTPRPRPRQQQPVYRNIYAAPHANSVTPVNRNHNVYVHNNDTSPVQSLDSGIDSLFNDISHRPSTVAAHVSYYNNDFEYDEAPIDDGPNMEELVFQLRSELKVLSSKIQRFENQNVAPAPQVMSPTGQKYPVYSPSQLRSCSVASSGSEGGRAKQGAPSPQMQSPNMNKPPMPHYQSNLPPRHSQYSQELAMDYAQPNDILPHTPTNKDRALGMPEKSYVRRPFLPPNQKSTPAISRPSSVSKVTPNSSQDRIPNGIQRPVPTPTRPAPNRTYASNVPRAQSSTGTATYSSLPTPRQQTPRYTPGPLMNRSVSPQPPPKTTARKPDPLRPPSSSRLPAPDGYHFDDKITKKPSRIPNPNPRYH